MVEQQASREMKPMPDPTVLTTEQLLREIGNAVRLVEAKIEGNHESTRQQFDGMRAEFLVRFDQIARRFDQVEHLRIEQKHDTEKAVESALTSAKDAARQQNENLERGIAKSESATAAQAGQQSATTNAKFAALDATVGDIKDRIVKMESFRLGGVESSTERRLDSSAMGAMIFGVIGVLAAIASIVIVLAMR